MAMKSLCVFSLALAAPLLASLALAQPAPGAMAMDGHCGPGAAASAASADCPRGMHSRRGMHRMMRGGPDNTSGWPMMTAAERNAHHDKLRSFKSHDECKAYMDEHHAQMQERAQTAGRAVPAQPRRDVCAALKPATK
jgi:hypothetical protein